jgi:hypothetical protein
LKPLLTHALRIPVPPVPEGFREKPVEYNNVTVVINRNTGRAFESSAGPVGTERDLSPLE